MDSVPTDFVDRARQRVGEGLLRTSLSRSRVHGARRSAADDDLRLVVLGGRRGARDAAAGIGSWLEGPAGVPPELVTERDFERPCRNGSAFWRNSRRDEVVLWPRPPSLPL